MCFSILKNSKNDKQKTGLASLILNLCNRKLLAKKKNWANMWLKNPKKPEIILMTKIRFEIQTIKKCLPWNHFSLSFYLSPSFEYKIENKY